MNVRYYINNKGYTNIVLISKNGTKIVVKCAFKNDYRVINLLLDNEIPKLEK